MNAEGIENTTQKLRAEIQSLSHHAGQCVRIEGAVERLHEVRRELDAHRQEMKAAEKARKCAGCQPLECVEKSSLCEECWEAISRNNAAMEAAEKPTCNGCGAVCDRGTPILCPSCNVRAIVPTVPDQFDRIDSRLAKIEQGHDDLNVAYRKVRQRLAKIERIGTTHTFSRDRDTSSVTPIQPSEEQVDATIAEAVSENDGLLKRLAKMDDTTNRVAEEEFYAEPPAPPVSERNAAVIALLDTWMADESNYDEEAWVMLKARLNPPPVEVEMRVKQVSAGGWTWECCWAGIWFAPEHDSLQHAFTTNGFAKGAAHRWLAALSKQLGVPLKAKWVESETPAKTAGVGSGVTRPGEVHGL